MSEDKKKLENSPAQGGDNRSITPSGNTPTEESAPPQDTGFVRGKLFYNSTSKDALKKAEKYYGYSWVQLHGYKELTALPKLPPSMNPTDLAEDGSACQRLFDGLERCIFKNAVSERPLMPHQRLQICKPHWVKLTRCVRRRDERLLDTIQKWESDHINRMTDDHKKDYLSDMKQRLAYLEYVEARSQFEAEVYRISKECNHLRRRIYSLEGGGRTDSAANKNDPASQARFRWLMSRGISQDPVAPVMGALSRASARVYEYYDNKTKKESGEAN